MTLRASKSKSNSAGVGLTIFYDTTSNDEDISKIESLKNRIEYNEKTLNLFVNHVIFNLNANIDDMKLLIDQKRPERKTYKYSTCDLWLRLKTIEQMGPFSLVNFLRMSQLHRLEIDSTETTNDSINTIQGLLLNPRQSRLVHFNICSSSDEFNFDINSYVGLLIFSYNNQSKFVLNGHYCQRGDIIIKETKSFSQANSAHRGMYNSLFTWYFGRTMNEKFIGVGFLCVNGKWRFDLISSNDKELLRYEYQIFDMFLLTHWLTQDQIVHNAYEMEIHAKDLLLKQHDIVKKKIKNEDNTDILNNWEEFIGSDINDLKIAIEQFNQRIENEIESIFKETKRFSTLIKENIQS